MEKRSREERLTRLEKKISGLLKDEEFQPIGEEGSGLGWFPPKCPVCNNLIGQKFASNRLVCVICDKEFELKEVH